MEQHFIYLAGKKITANVLKIKKKIVHFAPKVSPPLPVRTARSGSFLLFYAMTKNVYSKPFLLYEAQIAL